MHAREALDARSLSAPVAPVLEVDGHEQGDDDRADGPSDVS